MKEKQKAEAIARMEMLGIINEAIQQFKNDGTVMRSEHLKLAPGAEGFGSLYWLTDEEKQMVEKFEDGYDALVYMVIQTQANSGLHKAMLYVSDDMDEWEMDREDLEESIPMAYVVNCDIPEYSEFGSIGIKSAGGGLIRTW